MQRQNYRRGPVGLSEAVRTYHAVVYGAGVPSDVYISNLQHAIGLPFVVVREVSDREADRLRLTRGYGINGIGMVRRLPNLYRGSPPRWVLLRLAGDRTDREIPYRFSMGNTVWQRVYRRGGRGPLQYYQVRLPRQLREAMGRRVRRNTGR